MLLLLFFVCFSVKEKSGDFVRSPGHTAKEKHGGVFTPLLQTRGDAAERPAGEYAREQSIRIHMQPLLFSIVLYAMSGASFGWNDTSISPIAYYVNR